MGTLSRTLRALFVASAMCGLFACSTLPAEPRVAGPRDEVAIAGGFVATRELVWVSSAGTLRIEATRMCREESDSSEGCVHISMADRLELDRFFGATSFRTRWGAFRPCPVSMDADTHAFRVTFADGQSVAKWLDGPADSPFVLPCDRALHDAVAATGDDLVRRYFR